MKTIGTDQLLAMKFERMPVSDKFRGLLGRIPYSFVIILFGDSGNGKTELAIQLAIEFEQHGTVEWLAYETGHDADIQDAATRNNLKGKKIKWSDPFDKLPTGVSLFEDLYKKINKPKSAKYWFIDSADATQFNEEQAMELQRLAKKKKKGLIWLSHADGKKPATHTARKIQYYGHVGIYVKYFIAQCLTKNRFGGFKPYVIYEERARELNPLHFEKQAIAEAEQAKAEKKQRKTTKNKNQPPQNEKKKQGNTIPQEQVPQNAADLPV